LGGCQATGATLVRVQREIGRTLVKGCGGGQPGPGAGAGGRTFQFGGDVFVRTDGGVGAVPCTAIGIDAWIGGVRQCPVNRPPVAELGSVVDRGAHEWVAEADPGAEVDQFGGLGGGRRLRADVQLLGGAPEQTHVADRFSGRYEQQQLGVAGQRFDAPQEAVLDAPGERAGSGYCEAARELVRGQPARQFLQRQGVAMRLCHDSVANVLIQRCADRRREQLAGIRLL
jgi:hypothetical protein